MTCAAPPLAQLAEAEPSRTPVASVIIPAYNRVAPLQYTLRSVAAAAALMPAGAVQVLLVDDGSEPPLREQLGGYNPGVPVIFLRQANQGSIVARQTGLAAARGAFVLFLDSDDLIAPEKLVRHATAHRLQQPDIVYDDVAAATLGPDFSACFAPAQQLRPTTDLSELLLRIQPLPHCPTYRREWLMRALAKPVVPARRDMDPAGDVWLYYNLLGNAAQIVKIDEPLTAIGPHPECRYSLHWEKLGVAALLIAERFQAGMPITPDSVPVHRQVGAVAFDSWRRLPREFCPEFKRRLLAVWRRAPSAGNRALGGPVFRLLATVLGPVGAGELLRYRNQSYRHVRTLAPHETAALLEQSGRGAFAAEPWA